MGFYNAVIAAWKLLFMSAFLTISGMLGLVDSQLSYEPPASPPALTTSVPQQATEPTTTSAAVAYTPNKAKPTAATTTPAKPAITTSTTTRITAPPVFSALSGQAANIAARTSLVNILCTTGAGGYFNPISGSGVIIDTRGVILTNAHVGQFFLLRDFPSANNIQCVVRMGSPAQPMYTARLLYLPQAWITANASQVGLSVATGTGENDFSLLLITGTTNPNGSLPASFPALPLTLDEPVQNEQVLLAAYPAGYLGGATIETNLYQSSAFSSVGQLYSYSKQQHVDLFSLSGTVVSQSGSSGGAVVDPSGSLTGIISTADIGTTTARNLNAISVSHVDRGLKAQDMGGIEVLLSHQNLTQIADDFANTIAPTETKALEDVLNKR